MVPCSLKMEMSKYWVFRKQMSNTPRTDVQYQYQYGWGGRTSQHIHSEHFLINLRPILFIQPVLVL